ncbi:MAG: discoidin domain-containing protein [Verrucomicrobiota bacterium]
MRPSPSRFLVLLLSVACAVSILPAAPSVSEAIPAESRWAVQVDLDALRAGPFGRYLLDDVLIQRLPQRAEGLTLDYAAMADLVARVTLFGDELGLDPNGLTEAGVALIEGKPGLSALVDGVVAFQIVQGAVTVVQTEPWRVVRLQNGVLVASLGDDRVGVANALPLLERAVATLRGEHPNLAETGRLAAYPVPSEPTAVVAIADGLGELVGLPPQARVFQLTEGFLLQAGERAGALQFAGALQTRSPDNARLVGQILQGLLAFSALARVDDLSLGELVRNTSVETAGASVRLRSSLPVEPLKGLIDAALPPVQRARDATGGERLALTVMGSSLDRSVAPRNLLDGDPATVWRTRERTMEASLVLEEVVTAKSFAVDWVAGVASGLRFTLSTSLDGEQWGRSIVWVGEGRPPESIALSPTEARFLRLELSQEGNAPLGIADLRLNGRPPAVASIEASTELAHDPANLVDDRPATTFAGLGQPVTVDLRLEEAARLQEIGFFWAEDGNRRVEVHASRDGVEWTRILALSQPVAGGALRRFNSTDIEARFLRLIGPEPAAWSRLAEVRVYGVKP